MTRTELTGQSIAPPNHARLRNFHEDPLVIPHLSSGDYMMSPNEFSELYYDGAPIFDNACQNAGMGPWLIISEDWATYKSRYGC